MKKYNNKSNVIGPLIRAYREKNKMRKIDICSQLELYAVYIDSTELKRIEDGTLIVKDFELIALFKVLNIDYNKLQDLI